MVYTLLDPSLCLVLFGRRGWVLFSCSSLLAVPALAPASFFFLVAGRLQPSFFIDRDRRPLLHLLLNKVIHEGLVRAIAN